MRKLLVLLCFLFMSCAHMPKWVRSSHELKQINNSVVALITKSSRGGYRIYCTGVFISRTEVLTAGHCVASSSGGHREVVKVATFDDFIDTEGTFLGHWHSFDVTAYSPFSQDDLAVLRISPGTDTGFRHASLSVSRSTPGTGEHVVLLGHPSGIGWSLTDGVISYANRRFPKYLGNGLYIQTSAQAAHGNSGGPLLNHNNEIIGILSRGSLPHLAFAIHKDVVVSFLKEYKLEDKYNE